MNLQSLLLSPSALTDAVANGLQQTPRRLPSWLFYDMEGDRIFQEIMALPEYYLTRSEYSILQANKDQLLEHFSQAGEPFDLIELGAGDGTKTELLLAHFLKAEVNFTYRPVDISPAVIDQLVKRLSQTLPSLTIRPVAGRYEEVVDNIKSDKRKIYLFMGANIGNFEWDEAVDFLQSISQNMDHTDQLLVGFDLKKDPAIIRSAYDDPQGITARFNLNVLNRINRELGADFDISAFQHSATYDPNSGEARSYLVSLKSQRVFIDEFQESFAFEEQETIHTEISLKYDQQMIENLAEETGLQILDQSYDERQYFSNVLFGVR